MEQYSLSQLNQMIGKALKSLEPTYWVVAEIGELRLHQNGHCYLDLIEKSGSRIIAKSRATIWSYTYSGLSQQFKFQTGSDLSTGMNVLVNASVQYHEVYGLSLNINDIDPNFTIGERHRKKQEVINKLERLGLLDKNKGQTLPLVPQRIAIISSATAAGFDDFRHQLDANPYGYAIHWQLFDTILQGDMSINSILHQLSVITQVQEQFDLLVIIRGGGAQTDFDTFDDFQVCEAVANFPKPVITGIGHERDNTVTDLVAHTRMKTPTAVAEFIISGILNYENLMLNSYEHISNIAQKEIHKNKEQLTILAADFKFKTQKFVHESEISLNQLNNNVKSGALRWIEIHRERLVHIEQKIESGDPRNILNKGYTITTINGKMIRDAIPKPGDQVTTTTRSTSFNSTVENLESH